MSYEGRQQVWCENGHHWETDAYDTGLTSCPTCKKAIAFVNDVDDTNGDSYGYIEPIEQVPAKYCTCICGNKHVTEPARYKIPTKADCERARTAQENAALDEYSQW